MFTMDEINVTAILMLVKQSFGSFIFFWSISNPSLGQGIRANHVEQPT